MQKQKNTKVIESELPPQRTAANGYNKLAEIGGVKAPEPTRYGDWEKNGRCTDF